ncbi:hypothetical protein PPYR_11709 [Photinus pyralis]|uniref:Peptidase M20 dimerisation domain-containing protein n=2 Tax=Photinus pyralis TaxID=7054 RepID=A0A5N4AC17_PHOPY|nr:cytosolic non-specific dipeptidase-like [Photinus pyralis]KAB0794870.1 hypothetical protein PPYR_11709 [Photinus pyralis]
MVYPHTFRTEHSETRTTSSTYGDFYHKTKEVRISIQPNLLKILRALDGNRRQFIENLREMVKIPSVSGSLKYVDEVQRCIDLVINWLVKLGVRYQPFNIGRYKLEGKENKRPSVILASLGENFKKKTVCVYAHLDVNLPDLEQWKTDPFDLTEVDLRLYGSGVASGKGTLMSWFNLIYAFQEANVDIPVNIKFIIESLHYYDSDGLEEFISKQRIHFLSNVDYYIVCDSEWLVEKTPCLVYGSVGRLRLTCKMERNESAESDMKEDMAKIFGELCSERGEILVQNFHDLVKQITPDEEHIYESIKFDVADIRDNLPEHQKSWDKVKLLMNFWRLPSIAVEDTEECTCEKNDKSKIKRNFTVKIVQNQIVDVAIKQITKHIKKTCQKLDIKHKVDIEVVSTSRPWMEDILSVNYFAARRALIQIYRQDPNMIREDCDMKVVTMLSVLTERCVLVLPLGDNHINAGRSNENIRRANYYDGMKVLGAYLFQIAELADRENSHEL